MIIITHFKLGLSHIFIELHWATLEEHSETTVGPEYNRSGNDGRTSRDSCNGSVHICCQLASVSLWSSWRAQEWMYAVRYHQYANDTSYRSQFLAN